MGSPADARGREADRKLWAGLLLGLAAAGCNTVVGFTVSHYACDTNTKFSLWIVMLADLAACVVGYWVADSARTSVEAAEDQQLTRQRRDFMRQMATITCIYCAVITVAGTLAVVLLHPCD